MKNFWRSKKVKALLLGIGAVILTTTLGLSEAVAKEIIILVGVYIGAQGISDGLSKGETSSMND